MLINKFINHVTSKNVVIYTFLWQEGNNFCLSSHYNGSFLSFLDKFLYRTKIKVPLSQHMLAQSLGSIHPVWFNWSHGNSWNQSSSLVLLPVNGGEKKQGLDPRPQDVFCYCAIVHSSVLGINVLVLAICLTLALACSIGPKENQDWGENMKLLKIVDLGHIFAELCWTWASLSHIPFLVTQQLIKHTLVCLSDS